MTKLFKKQNVLIAFVLTLVLSLAAFAVNLTTAKADNAYERPSEDVVIDADTTNLWLESNGQKWTNVNVDNNPYLPVFGDGTTKQIWADDIKGNEPLTIKFANKYKASNFGTVEVRMAVGNWHENNDIETFGYSLGDTAYENSAGSVKSGFQNPIVTLTLDAAKLADEEGYIGGIVLKKTQTDNELTGSVFVDYVKLVLKEISTEQPKIDEKPAEDLVIDGDTTNLWLESNGQKWTNVNVDNNPYLPVFGDGTTKQIWADDIKGNEPLTIKFANKYKASNFGTVEVRMAVGNWHENNDIETFGYSLGDTAYENSAGSVKSGFQNPIVTLTLDAAKLADEEGYIGGIVLKKTQTNNEFTGSMFVDYVKLALSNKQTGDVDEQPESNITVDFDGENAWLDGRKDKITADNDSGAPFFISDGANGSTKQTYTEYEDEAAFIVKLGRRYKAEFFDYVKIRLGASNWDGGNTVSVSGYAAGDNGFAKNAGSVKFGYGTFPKTLKLKASLLADEDGYISEIVIKKTHSSDGKKSSLGFDYLEFCLVGSEPEPVVAGEYTKKDISEVMPIGAGKEFNLVSYEEALNAVSIAASVKASAYDKLDFVLTPSYSGKFSAYILMKATTDKDTHENGGIFFWFTDTSVSVGAVSDGVTNTEEVSLSELPAGLFASGKATKVAVAAIPYQVDGSQEGYYCAVYLDGSETPCVEIYLANSSLTTGVYTNICTQDVGNDFSVKFGSTMQTPVSAEEIMNVKVATTSGKSEFKTPRAGLTLSYFEVAGETVGDLVIEGDAKFDKDTKFLTFTKAGTVKVSFTVKNAFGEFKSNELTVTYVSDEKPTESGSGDSSGKSGGCFGTITGVSVTAIFAAAAAIIIAKKKKND